MTVEELGDKAEPMHEHLYTINGQYEKAMASKNFNTAETSSEKCLDENNNVCCPNSSVIANNEVDKNEIRKGKENLRNSQFQIGEYHSKVSSFMYCHNKLESALRLHDEDKILWAIDSVRHWLDSRETVDYIRVIDKIPFYEQALAIVKELGNKAEQGRAYDNFRVIYFKIGQYEKANVCHLEHVGILRELGDKKEMEIAFSNMGNAYCSIGRYQKAIFYYTKALEIAEDLRDKRGVVTARRNIEIMSAKRIRQHEGVIGDHSKDLVLVSSGMGSVKKNLHRSSCDCVWILRVNCIPEQIIKRLQDGDLGVKHLNKPTVSSGSVVMVTESSTHGVVIRCTEHVIKGTCQTFLNAAGNEDDARPDERVACQCNKIFFAIGNVLHEGNLDFVTIKTCQENRLNNSYDKTLVPSDEDVVVEVDALTTKMSLIKDRMASLFMSDVSEQRAAKYGEMPLNEIQLKELVELCSEHQATLRQFILIKDELFSRTNAQELKRRESNSTQSNPGTEAFPHDLHQTRANNSGVNQEAKETATNVPMLLNYFSSCLNQQDWNGLRRVLSPQIPENVLCSLQDGNGFFQELLDRGLISDQNMELLRDAFYQIERIDCVHFIDSAKDGQCLLELENAEQGQAVSGATSEGYNQSVTAVQENRSITDEEDQLEGATGFQMSSDKVEDGRESFGEIAESNAAGRSNEESQGHETGENGWNRELPRNYENPTSVFQGSFTGPVQEVAAFCSNPLQLRSNEISSQSRSKDGPQGFDAGKGSDYHLATRHTRQFEKQTLPHGECSNDGTTQNEPNHAGSCKDEICTTGSQKTGSQKTGSQKTGSCESENVDTGSCETDNTSNANAVSFKNGSRDAEKCKNESCEAGSNKAGSCNGEPNAGASSNPGNFQHKSRRRKKRNAKWSKQAKFACVHYDRYCDVQFGCCKEFWACHRCHNTNSKCEEKNLRSKDIKNIRCKRCSTIQEFPKEDPSCVECGLRFADYFCAICQHLTGKQSHPYHCIGCGICRVHEDRSFHCDVCGVCLDVKLLENHICRPGSAHDQCCICFEDAFNGCQILPCSHKIHKDCATAMLKNGIRTCPVCRQSFEHKLEYRPIDK